MKLIRLVLVLLIATVAAGCGEDSAQKGNEVDRAFASQMIPHHEMAVMMARMGDGRAERPEVKKLIDDVIRTQTAEIKTLRTVAEDLGADSKMDHGDHSMHSGSDALGLSASEMGMDMGDMSSLRTADDFNRAFVEQMIPHHEGAIRMARVQLEKGSDERLNRLAEDIIESQQREIDQMRGWLKDW